MTKFKITIIIILFTGLLSSSCNRNIAQSRETKQYYYSCPMHPEFIIYQPGKCFKCGMPLEKWEVEKKKSGHLDNSHSSSSSSEGHNSGFH
jgi:hypothetical protein